MAELFDICGTARAFSQRGEPMWLATVVRVRGSAYRQPGARLLFSNERPLAGSVSAGCLEAEIIRKGPWLSREHPVCITYDGSREDRDTDEPRGTGCDGAVEVLIERVTPRSSGLGFIEACLQTERRGALVTVIQCADAQIAVGARIAYDADGVFSSDVPRGEVASGLALAAEATLRGARATRSLVQRDGVEALIELIEPPPHLFLFGSGPDVVPVVELAHVIGFGVTVCDARGRLSARERFSALTELHFGTVRSALPKIEARLNPVVVVMSHHYPTDREALEMLLSSRARYIGMLGPARRTARMLGEIFAGDAKLSARDRARLRAPVGLDLGAETPQEIALSVISEIQAVLAQASAAPLSTRDRPIHATSHAASPAPTPVMEVRLARTGST